MTRTEHNDENDTRKTIQRLDQLRAQKAKLLGFDTYAAYSLSDQMANTPENALKLLTDTVPAATAMAEGEIAEMQKVIDDQGGGFKQIGRAHVCTSVTNANLVCLAQLRKKK